MPGPVTCFQGVHALVPGHYLDVHLAGSKREDPVREHTYWEWSFPDRGDEDWGPDPERLVDEFEGVLLQAVARPAADVPVVSYLSGGVDSSLVVAVACHARGADPDVHGSYRGSAAGRDRHAAVVADHVGTESVVVGCSAADVLDNYPAVVRAVEAPVVDTSSVAVLMLARAVHERGYKACLTGEGADEWLAGYPWFKVDRLLGCLDFLPGPPSLLLRRGYLKLAGGPQFSLADLRRSGDAFGGYNAWLDMHGLMSLSKFRFFSRPMLDAVADHSPVDDLGLDPARLRRWHPLNRALYLAGRVHLPGLLLSVKGDRVAMQSAVEGRYPFLDEDVFAFLARLHPRWKLRGFRDKYLLRLLAERWLPKSIAWRRKAMFRRPWIASTRDTCPPTWSSCSVRSRCAGPATLTRRPCTTGGRHFKG